MSILRHYIWLSTRKGINPIRISSLISHFGSVSAVYSANKSELSEVLGASVSSSLLDKNLDNADRILEKCSLKNIWIITKEDSLYPSRLKHIFDPPIVLYAKGNALELQNKLPIAIVGTRRATNYGLSTASFFAKELAKKSAIIVSGMADGIDTAAHKGALLANGTTIAVLGCSPDICFPKSNRILMDDIAATGLILSEYPPETMPYASNFPQRNRIISGISAAVLITEAPFRSGALITASTALEQGRDVFAVPGNIDYANSNGTNQLIRDGAYIATHPFDILCQYPDYFGKKLEKKPLKLKNIDNKNPPEKINLENPEPPPTEEEPKKEFVIDNTLPQLQKTVLTAVLNGKTTPDEIIASTQLMAAEVMPTLTILEIQKIIKRENGRFFIV